MYLQLRFVGVWPRVRHTNDPSSSMSQICLNFILERLPPYWLATWKTRNYQVRDFTAISSKAGHWFQCSDVQLFLFHSFWMKEQQAHPPFPVPAGSPPWIWKSIKDNIWADVLYQMSSTFLRSSRAKNINSIKGYNYLLEKVI